VGEFPELQGIIGAHLARAVKLPEHIALAITEHYQPIGENTDVPTANSSVACALIDKIYKLHAFFSIGERPTGSRDPYALRRAAIGFIRLIVENKISSPYFFRISDFFDGDVSSFLKERFIVYLRDKHALRQDIIRSVLAAQPFEDLTDLTEKIVQVHEFLKKDQHATAFIAGYNRALGILKQNLNAYSMDDFLRYFFPEEGNNAYFYPSERALATAIRQAEECIARDKSNYLNAFVVISSLRPFIDAFFEEVYINEEEDPYLLKEARLAMLAKIRALALEVADFSLIDGA
jgi:glycyl-tRNA synthetase beta chain